MLAELTAMRDALRSALQAVEPATSVGIGDMTGHATPFASVWATPGNRPDDEAAGGPRDDYSARLGVTFTAARSDAAVLMALSGISALTPGRRAKRLPVTGRTVWVEFVEARPVQVDRDVTLPGSGTHPAFVVVLFDVHSSPEPVTPEV